MYILTHFSLAPLLILFESIFCVSLNLQVTFLSLPFPSYLSIEELKIFDLQCFPVDSKHVLLASIFFANWQLFPYIVPNNDLNKELKVVVYPRDREYYLYSCASYATTNDICHDRHSINICWLKKEWMNTEWMNECLHWSRRMYQNYTRLRVSIWKNFYR